MSKSIVFFEIATADIPRARAFYSELFGWQFTDAPGVAMIATGEGMLIGCAEHRGGESTVVYFGVDTVRPTFERALALGGTEVIAPRVAPGKGSFAVFRDRDRNRIGIFSQEATP